jgi:hypothetical protein
MSVPVIRVSRLSLLSSCWILACSSGCGSSVPKPASNALSPVYNPTTGRLEELRSDRNGDGKTDTWAYMDGTRIVRIEIDRDGDGAPDRWEYYGTPPADGGAPPIDRAEEANGPDRRAVTRHERYEHGVVRAVDEDTDADGRPDKWELYTDGRLTEVDLDLTGQGRPDRRLLYGPTGTVTVEVDPRRDGHFVPVVPERGGVR